MNHSPNIKKVYKRFSKKPLLFELIPPEREQTSKEIEARNQKLLQLFERVEVNGINLPEIHEEKGKSKKGKRRSKFKPRLSPREYVQQLKKLIDTEYLICRVIVKSHPSEAEKWLVETNNDYGIRNIVIVGGEQEADAYEGLSVPEGTRLIKENINTGTARLSDIEFKAADYLVGNISIATRRLDTIDEPDRIIYKIKHGADFFTTQIIAEPDSPVKLLSDLAPLLQEENLNPPLFFWSFSPISEQKDIDFMRWLGVYIPDKVEKRIMGSSDPAAESLQWNIEIWNKLQQATTNLDIKIPLGINISFMGMRNYDHAVELAAALKSEMR
ncbi:MAG: methylenetetrahydrofolate reductase [bacterium]